MYGLFMLPRQGGRSGRRLSEKGPTLDFAEAKDTKLSLPFALGSVVNSPP